MLWKSLLFSPAILGASLVFGSSAIATETQSTAEVALPQAAVGQNVEALRGAAPIQQGDAPENTAPAALAADDLATVFSTDLVLEQQPEAKSQLQTPLMETGTSQTKAQAAKATASTQVSETWRSKSLADKAQGKEQVSVTARETTVAQAAPSNSANTIDQIIRYGKEGAANRNSSGQVTSVSQLRDVQPTDWAFQALQSLVERYGCIEGYPDRTYRGNRALTRYEFAAGLNKCLDRIQELIAALPQGVSKEDLAALQRLQEEFAAELATLRGRVDTLEARVNKLESQQFSTTTKLRGEAIFQISDVFGGKRAAEYTERGRTRNNLPSRYRLDVEDANNTVFQDRVRLEFQTSFSGQDVLHTRIVAGNAVRWNNFPSTRLFPGGSGPYPGSAFAGAGAGPTAEGTFATFYGSTGNNSVALDWLAYETNFLGGSKLYLAATGGLHYDYADVKNPYFFDGDGGQGALSTFAQANPIYRIGGGAGAAISFGIGGLGNFLKGSSITAGYLAGGSGIFAGNTPYSANSPNDKNGLFNGNYSALGQLDLNFCDTLNLALTYVHAYHTTGSDIFDSGGGASARLVGTGIANLPSALIFNRNASPVVTNSYGVSGNLRLSKYFSISGWGMYTDATMIRRGSGDIWSYGLGVAIPNLGRPGNLLGLFAGAEPYLTELSVGPRSSFRRDIPWHIEGFYRFQLTDNISVTPGVIWLMAPEQNKNNDDIFIGTLRTTFSF